MVENIAWDNPQAIRPVWARGRLPVLSFPASRQKNKRREETPMCPWMEDLLREIPEADRTGWVFDPWSRKSSWDLFCGKRGKMGRMNLKRDIQVQA